MSARRWPILVAAVLSFFSVGATFFAVPPMVPELIARFGLGHFQIGLLMGAIAIPAIVLSIPLGLGVDRWPLRMSGQVALAIMLVGALFFALAPNFLSLVIGRICFGFGGLLLNLLLARVLSEAFAGRELGLAMGVFMAVYPAAMIVVFLAHPHLLASLGWRVELLMLAVLVLVSWPLFRWAMPPDEAAEDSTVLRPELSSVFSLPLIGLSISWMLFFAAFAAIPTFAPEWIGGDHALHIVTLIMWVSLVASPLVGFIMGRGGRLKPWLLAGLGLLTGTLVNMAFGSLLPIPAMLLVGICAAIVPTACYALPARIVSPGQIGLAFGVMTACSNLGTLVGPAVAGGFRDASKGWELPWLILGVFSFLGLMAAVVIQENPTRLRRP